jgi:hypothetical protein
LLRNLRICAIRRAWLVAVQKVVINGFIVD